MGASYSNALSPIETVVSCGGAFNDTESNGLFEEVIYNF